MVLVARHCTFLTFSPHQRYSTEGRTRPFLPPPQLFLMYRPISQSREVSSKGRIRAPPLSLRSSAVVNGPEHARLTYQYYETLSKPRSDIFAPRPYSALDGSEHDVPLRDIDAPEVVRAATPFTFLAEGPPSAGLRPAGSVRRLPPMETRPHIEGNTSFPELNNDGDPELTSFGVGASGGVGRRSVSRSSVTNISRPPTAASDKLICFVGDRPLAFYSSSTRRGAGRMRSAGAVSSRNQMAQQEVLATPISQAEISRQSRSASHALDTQLRLNQLLRCRSASSRHSPGPSLPLE